jgi:hypothetical protein
MISWEGMTWDTGITEDTINSTTNKGRGNEKREFWKGINALWRCTIRWHNLLNLLLMNPPSPPNTTMVSSGKAVEERDGRSGEVGDK